MAHRRTGLPPRVVIIAVALLTSVGLLAWLVRGLGSPASPPPESAALLDDVAADETPTGEPGAQDAAGELVASGGPETPEAVADAQANVPAIESAVAMEQVTLQLFLVDPATQRLTTRIRRIDAPMTLPAQAQLALQALASWRDAELLSPLPPGTAIREVWVSPGGIAYVDFPRTFPASLDQGSQAELYAVYGVVGTLTSSFPNIRAVQFLVDGAPVDTLVGHVDLSAPITPLVGWVF